MKIHRHWPVAASNPPTTSPMTPAANGSDLVQAERQTSLILRERVGQDRSAVREQECPADALHHSKDDEFNLAAGALAPCNRTQDRSDCEYSEPEIVQADAAEDVGQSTEVTSRTVVATLNPSSTQSSRLVCPPPLRGLTSNAREHHRQGDNQDGAVDGSHQDAKGRVGQGDPFI